MNNTYHQSADPQGGTRQKKEIHNQWQGTGILRSRSKDENEPLKFITWPSGGGVINAYLKVSENIGIDENGAPKVKRVSIPVSIMTNKNITAQQLQSLMSGTKVHVVGKLELETYDSKKTNTKVSTLVVKVYVLNILEVPMQTYQQQYPVQPQGGYYPGQPQPAQPQYPGQPQYHQHPQYSGQPQYQAQPQYSPQPGQQMQPQYQPQPAYQGQPQYSSQPNSQVPPQAPPPPPPGWYNPGQEINIDDLPPA